MAGCILRVRDYHKPRFFQAMSYCLFSSPDLCYCLGFALWIFLGMSIFLWIIAANTETTNNFVKLSFFFILFFLPVHCTVYALCPFFYYFFVDFLPLPLLFSSHSPPISFLLLWLLFFFVCHFLYLSFPLIISCTASFVLLLSLFSLFHIFCCIFFCLAPLPFPRFSFST